jgi:prepilin-type N-terminal cleavage/methylation domain-containing protein
MGNCQEPTMPKPTPKSAGFSMLELLVSLAILLVVGAVAFSFLMQYQNYYQSTALKADMHSGLRAATTLLQQEIGQAGLVSLTATCSAAIPATSTSGCPTLTAAVTPGATSATLSSTAGIFVGESLLIDVGLAQESVNVKTVPSSTSITTVTSFVNSHSSGAVVSATGMFPQGILSPGQTGGSTSTQLNMIGDLIGDGNLYYVQYNCTPPTLSRSVTPLTGPNAVTAQQAAVPLLDDLAANPNGAPCFQYSTASVTVGGTPYTFTTTVSLTLTVQTSEIDPITKTQSQETKSFLNLEPRNVLAGYNLAQYVGTASYFQPNPSALCSGLSPLNAGTPSPPC